MPAARGSWQRSVVFVPLRACSQGLVPGAPGSTTFAVKPQTASWAPSTVSTEQAALDEELGQPALRKVTMFAQLYQKGVWGDSRG